MSVENQIQPIKKKVALIGTVGLPAQYGGFETLAEHLVRNLDEEYDFIVYCSKKKYPKAERKEKYSNAKLKYLPFDANGIQSIFYDTISIIHAAFTADILLILGVAGAWFLPFVKIFTNKKIIISVDGIDWKRDKWSFPAKIYLWWAEKMAVNFSHFDIADNESIQDYTAIRYKTLSMVIEYGADHTMKVEPTESDKLKYDFLNEKYFFKVCRIEPENNIHLILESFKNVPQKILVLVGNWDKSEYGIELKKTFSSSKNIILLDPIYNQREIDLIRGNAYCYIHGHSAGGTNPSLVEAMYLDLPVIAYNVSYNKTTTEEKAIYFKTVADLIQILQTITDEKLKRNAHDMKQIAEKRYKWRIIADKYKLLFEESYNVKSKIKVQHKISDLDREFLRNNLLGNFLHVRNFYERK